MDKILVIEKHYARLGKLGIAPDKDFKTRVFLMNEIINTLWDLKITVKQELKWL